MFGDAKDEVLCGAPVGSWTAKLLSHHRLKTAPWSLPVKPRRQKRVAVLNGFLLPFELSGRSGLDDGVFRRSGGHALQPESCTRQ